jgi:hypothetical protein
MAGFFSLCWHFDSWFYKSVPNHFIKNFPPIGIPVMMNFWLTVHVVHPHCSEKWSSWMITSPHWKIANCTAEGIYVLFFKTKTSVTV